MMKKIASVVLQVLLIETADAEKATFDTIWVPPSIFSRLKLARQAILIWIIQSQLIILRQRINSLAIGKFEVLAWSLRTFS